jgi:dTDP-glucose 4,6-dehydratase
VKFLVTGGAGFIGSHFARQLLKTGASSVTILDSLTYAADLRRIADLEGSVEFIEGSIGDERILNSLQGKINCIVNFAAETHVDNSISAPTNFIQSNITELIPLLQFASKNNIRFHQVSTDEVFGDLELGSGTFNHLTPYKPSSPYAASKASSDHLVRAWARTFALKATISICSNNYGTWQHTEKLLPKSINCLLQGTRPQLYGQGINERDWIHVDDHVSGILATLDRGIIGETYLFGGGNVWSNKALVGLLNSIFGREPDDFDLIEDRLGHDKRYAIDYSKSTELLGWAPKNREMKTELISLVHHQQSLS